MGNPMLMPLNAGRGETPPCPEAVFKRGDIVRVPKSKRFPNWPLELVVLVAVPSGFSPSYALADLLGNPRPLMCQVGRRGISYILCDAAGGDTTPYLARERDLRATGQSVEIGTISQAPAHDQ